MYSYFVIIRHNTKIVCDFFRPTSMFGSVVWPKGRPPTDMPECGFNNELCTWLTSGNTTSQDDRENNNNKSNLL